MTTMEHAVGWVPVRREDGELIGFVTETEGGWLPLTVFGYPIDAAGDRDGDGAADRDAAQARLHAVGLSYLARRWELRERQDWISVELVEASPSAVTVQLVDFFDYPDRYGERHTLSVPVGDRLRRA